MPPPPYSSQHDQSVPATQFSHSPVFLSSSSVLLNNKHTQFVHGPSVYYNSGPHDRFGFNPSAPIVPPGTEPDLQALNNPYIVVARCQVRVYSGRGSGQVRTKADKGEGQRAGQGISPAGVETNWIQRQGGRALIPCVGSGQGDGVGDRGRDRQRLE